MLQIRRRWPVLAALIAAVSYGANHYRIAGFEHLRLEPRPETAPLHGPQVSWQTAGWPPNPMNTGNTWGNVSTMQPSSLPTVLTDAPNYQSFSVPSTNSYPQFSASTPNSGSSSWQQNLSLSEKFAMWQAERTVDQRDLPSTRQPSTRSAHPEINAAPIPIPPGFAASHPSFSTPPSIDPLSIAPLSIVPPQPQHGAADIMPGNMVSTGTTTPQMTGIDSTNMTRMAKTIRIASFNTASLGPAKLAKPHVLETLVGIIRQYDVIAIQEVQSSRDDILPMIVDKLNQSGRSYDYMVGPRVGRAAPHDQFAIVFDTSRVETDRYQLYTVDDPEDLIQYEPLVAWFRCKGVPQAQAFTFSLANLRIDSNLGEAERAILPGLIEAIQKDGRGEDDWIVAGDIAGSVSQLTALDQSGIRFAIRDIPTDITGMRMLDTIFFSARATTEYTGRAGVFDFLRKYNLSLERALEISDHMPVWAEFSIVEGAEPGRVAPADPQSIY